MITLTNAKKNYHLTNEYLDTIYCETYYTHKYGRSQLVTLFYIKDVEDLLIEVCEKYPNDKGFKKRQSIVNKIILKRNNIKEYNEILNIHKMKINKDFLNNIENSPFEEYNGEGDPQSFAIIHFDLIIDYINNNRKLLDCKIKFLSNFKDNEKEFVKSNESFKLHINNELIYKTALKNVKSDLKLHKAKEKRIAVVNKHIKNFTDKRKEYALRLKKVIDFINNGNIKYKNECLEYISKIENNYKHKEELKLKIENNREKLFNMEFTKYEKKYIDEIFNASNNKIKLMESNKIFHIIKNKINIKYKKDILLDEALDKFNNTIKNINLSRTKKICLNLFQTENSLNLFIKSNGFIPLINVIRRYNIPIKKVIELCTSEEINKFSLYEIESEINRLYENHRSLKKQKKHKHKKKHRNLHN